MTQVLYRKYRPKTFSEIKGQEHVVQTLKGALELNRVAHAYLFCGPRGTGKTTIARIFAKALNCANLSEISEGNFSGKLSIRRSLGEGGSHYSEPCNKCDSCVGINENRSIDIIEIDGASNRGIDEIRNIKEIARVAASQNKYKVFIIDEVHSLTKDAFNALLKTLEEPPEHVKFILATTEPHKLLSTVLSRVQRFDFRKLQHFHIIHKLKDIAAKEKIKVDDGVLRIIAANSEGSLRDAESNFAKVISLCGDKITLEDAKNILDFIPFELYVQLMDILIKKQREAGIKLVNEIYENGIDLENFTKGFLDFSRKIIIAKASDDFEKLFEDELSLEQLVQIKKFSEAIETKKLIQIIQYFMNVKHEIKIAPIPQFPLELAVIELSENA